MVKVYPPQIQNWLQQVQLQSRVRRRLSLLYFSPDLQNFQLMIVHVSALVLRDNQIFTK